MNDLPTKLSVRLMTTLAEVEGIASEWNRLAGDVPFRRAEWQLIWWRNFGRDQQLFVLTVLDGERCVGIAPCYTTRTNPLGHVLRLLGSGEVCTDQQSILAESGREAEVGTALATWFAADFLDKTKGLSVGRERGTTNVPAWDLFEFDGVMPDSLSMASFLETLEKHGFTARRRSTVSTWCVPLPKTIDGYLESLSKPCRRKVRTALKRFASNECHVWFAENEDEFERLWDQFIVLHQRRRNSLGEGGCFISDKFSHFLFDAGRAFQQAGLLDFACVEIGGRPIATEICFRGHTTTYAYQIGIDPDALRENPGWLVNTASIQHALALGQTGFDLCRGDEAYKRHLGALPTPCETVRIVPPKWRSQLWDAALETQSTLKGWVKAGLLATGISSPD